MSVRVRRLTRRVPGGWRSGVLLLPLLVLDLCLFLLPMGYLLRVSFAARTQNDAFVPGSWSLDGYQYVFGTGLVRKTVLFTLLFGVVVTVLAVAIGVVYAYAAWQASGWQRTVLLGGIVLLLFTTLVVRLFAVLLVFSPAGILNDLLTGLGLASGPLLLVDNLFGAVLAQLYIVVPYAVLAVYAVLSTLDRELIEAARDLGASRPRAVRAVVLPHIRPGMAVATIIAFTWSVGAYAGPLLLGSESELTAGILTSRLLLRQFDWPAASALAVVTVVIVLLTLVVALVRFGRGGGLADG